MSVPHLHRVPGRFVVEHLAHATLPEDDEWVALVRAPEGLTVVREAPPWVEAERWTGFYADTPSGTGAPGVLAAILAPLADAALPVFVASTYHADLVLVPEDDAERAAGTLRGAGVRVTVG
ncbi:ACT domain-containing protein [Actinomadura flavalba]|uniref:ACT domain-containing protein n=1 Tax=Actinomadura flavalba TaxID=1120938 RepID=UPI000368C88B|nr:ACT domain-containing protein [Actinomadura flavalba]